MKRKGLYRFETIAQDLVEGKLGRLFGGRLEPLDVAGRLVRVVEDSVGSNNGPLTFMVNLNSEDFRYLTTSNPNLADDIADAAWQIGKISMTDRFEKPTIKIIDDPLTPRHQVKITAETNLTTQDNEGNTKILSRNKAKSTLIPAMMSLDAFLIIQGRRHVPLNQPIITIGRRTDNDIVIALPTVSRLHAQIRWRFGRFVLYDVSARGKTMVNGHSTIEHVLQPGDVIALSDALLIYGEGHEVQSRSDDDAGDENTKTFVRPPKTK